MVRVANTFALVIAALSLFCVTLAGFAAPETYTNPVYAGDMPDPTVILYKGVYYAFGTTGSGRVKGRIFTLLRSTNLVEWKELGGAMEPPSPNPNCQYWAPEVTFANGKFYLYYAMGGIEPGHFENRVAVSSKPAGPYIDTGSVLVDCEKNIFTIDPFPFRDDDGQWYFFYSRDFTNAEPGVHIGTGIMVDRLVGMTNLAGDCHVVVRPRYDWTLYEANRRMNVYNATYDWHTVEGPCVLKHAGHYYCIYSGSSYRSIHYGLDCVMAEHPLGPYTGQGDSARVLHDIDGKVRGPGHNDVVVGPDGHTQYFVYHAWDADMTKRQMCIDRLLWSPDGPRCDGPTSTLQPAPMPPGYEWQWGNAVGALAAMPNSTPVHISYLRRTETGPEGEAAVFVMTNGESRAISVWNYQVQVRGHRSATNSSGWQTVSGDYPGAGQIGHLSAGAADSFMVTPPKSAPWRILILYSKGMTDGDNPRQYGGDYEVIGPEMKK